MIHLECVAIFPYCQKRVISVAMQLEVRVKVASDSELVNSLPETYGVGMTQDTPESGDNRNLKLQSNIKLSDSYAQTPDFD